MNAHAENMVEKTLLDAAQSEAIDGACDLIAPTWPLDQFIAVNPFWEMRHLPAQEVSARLAALAGIELVSERVLAAVDSAGDGKPTAEATSTKDGTPSSWSNFAAFVDQRRDLAHRMSWQAEIVEQISRFCARHFADRDAVSACPEDFYQSWLKSLRHDSGIAILMGEAGITEQFGLLPEDPDTLFAMAIDEMSVAPDVLTDYAHALLLDINGWASWVAYLRWQARLANTDHQLMRGLLAVRLGWELLLWRFMDAQQPEDAKSIKYLWQAQQDGVPVMLQRHQAAQEPAWQRQRAIEQAYQQTLAAGLLAADMSSSEGQQPALQAVFCIDVRSEPLRRSLERQHPGIQTKGFAGFFGLPIEFAPEGSQSARPQLPGLLSAGLSVREVALTTRGSKARSNAVSWQGLGNAAPAMFGLVEAAGLAYSWKLLTNSFFSGQRKSRHVTPLELSKDGEVLSIEAKADLAATILNAMGLIQNFADTVLLTGHGSRSRNNPHAAGLDCGACGGQSGEVNVRVLADLLNNVEVRALLRSRDITIPDNTRFIAALHDTTTDTVSSVGELAFPQQVDDWLTAAGRETRQLRADEGSEHTDSGLHKIVQRRAADWSEVRPEWGLANNAAFVAAPRARTRHLDLEGRVFLHDYDAAADGEKQLLQLILTAPMVVANWINMQYNASVMDNVTYGSGNKTLHNVLSGNVGLLEGQGGDLRIGLPLQSLHDGKRWRHTPQRLSVYVEAERDDIQSIYEQQAAVRALVDNEWLFLFQIDRNEIWQLMNGSWERVASVDSA